MPELIQTAADEARTPVVRRLASSVLLTEEEMDFLDALHVNRLRYKKGETLIAEDEEFEVCFAVLSGWGITYDIGSSGRRQIIGIALPGDLEGIHVNFDRVSAYTIAALTDMEVAMIEPARVLEIYQRFPVLASGLDWATVGSFNILSERNVSLGIREADQRILHFFLEMWCRLMLIGGAGTDGFELMMTQEQVGETLGISVVHTNKMLRKLREQGMIEMDGRKVSFPKPKQAMSHADFNPRYLNPTQKTSVSAAGRVADPAEQLEEMRDRQDG